MAGASALLTGVVVVGVGNVATTGVGDARFGDTGEGQPPLFTSIKSSALSAFDTDSGTIPSILARSYNQRPRVEPAHLQVSAPHVKSFTNASDSLSNINEAYRLRSLSKYLQILISLGPMVFKAYLEASIPEFLLVTLQNRNLAGAGIHKLEHGPEDLVNHVTIGLLGGPMVTRPVPDSLQGTLMFQILLGVDSLHYALDLWGRC
ncbi:hypothetical protein WG66_013046 [Moniliophthora roreri]|nr:hypothetical protein WG66_013046 [Moniliophthora roreri]